MQTLADAPAEEAESMSAPRQLHANEQTIEALARETEVSVEHVRKLFESELARLDAAAKIKTYLPVIAARVVRVSLQRVATAAVQ